jgi:hypothetical protein
VLNVLGLVAMIAFIVVVVSLAAGVTWVVVKFSPAKRSDQAS